MITLGVREFDGSSDSRRRFYGNKSEKSISLPKKLVGTRQVDRRKSRSMPDVRRRITEGYRLIDGSWPETRRKKRLTHRSKAAEVVLEIIVVSTMIKHENGR